LNSLRRANFRLCTSAAACWRSGFVAKKRSLKKQVRILAVDDEPMIGRSISSVLEAPHRHITVATNGQEALAKLAKENFDIVITDHRMPRSGGLELVRKLRQRDYEGKIVVLSAYLSPENIGVYEQLDVDEVLGKPFDAADLRQTIARLEDDIGDLS
jgi:CheY-like chemotaxis protein